MKTTIYSVIITGGWLGLVIFLSGCGQPRGSGSSSTPAPERRQRGTNERPSTPEAVAREVSGDNVSADAASTTDVTLADSLPRTADEHLALRNRLDDTLWSQEVDAQQHESVFIRLWDNLRLRPDPFEVLKEFPVQHVHVAQPGAAVEHDLGIRSFSLSEPAQSYNARQWHQWLDRCEQEGFWIEQTEWHHASFERLDAQNSRSMFNIVLDLTRESPVQRITIRGAIEVEWSDPPGQDPRPVTISTGDMRLLVRSGPSVFHQVHSVRSGSRPSRLMPLIVYDLDGDQLSDILLGGMNRIEFNQGDGSFRSEPICPHGLDIFDAAILADFTSDGFADLICVGPDRHPQILEGNEQGRFPSPPRRCAEFYLEFPKTFTAGDIDGDGDLDLWIGQYKFPYSEGAMPTPFYDANDGFPSVLLRNDGAGNFTDITAAAGLTEKRHRRSYSSSLVDLDDDGDLDLLVVSDFSGIDLYENDGRGRFTDVTLQLVYERHHFGMAHTMSDYDQDGLLDFYVIGMSSTTARRLDTMELGRDEFPEINRMRQVMGYGNRMYLSRDTAQGRRYERPSFAEAVARTGWSWGTTSFDFDNDGDKDIYVANGHTSGRSAKDYCTRYWCHDIYTGTSKTDPELSKLFSQSLRDLHRGDISWNGFEHNVLLANQAGHGFLNAAFLLGVGFESDGRSVVSDDLNADGRPDLLITEYRSDRRGDAEYELHVLLNELVTDRHWIGVRLSEKAGHPSPIGARITVYHGDRRQVARIITGDSFSAQHAPAAHFGLGDDQQVTAIEIQWLDGSTRRLENPAIDQWHAVTTAR